MRLWHYELLPYLPKSQLIAQKRECDLMLKDYVNNKKTNHILINYAWQYNIAEMVGYYLILEKEFGKRNLKFNTKRLESILPLNPTQLVPLQPYQKHQNDRYLRQCFYNLQEKFDRGQKDFTLEQYTKMEQFIKERGII